jgi:hypothetical protein
LVFVASFYYPPNQKFAQYLNINVGEARTYGKRTLMPFQSMLISLITEITFFLTGAPFTPKFEGATPSPWKMAYHRLYLQSQSEWFKPAKKNRTKIKYRHSSEFSFISVGLI